MTNRVPEIVEAQPQPTSAFIKAARVFILLGVWILVTMAAFAVWLATANEAFRSVPVTR